MTKKTHEICRDIRKTLGYSQCQFAFLLGVGVTSIHYWESAARPADKSYSMFCHLSLELIRALGESEVSEINRVLDGIDNQARTPFVCAAYLSLYCFREDLTEIIEAALCGSLEG